MTDRFVVESLVTDVQWIKKLFGWGLFVAGAGLLLLFSVIVYFDKSLHAAILASQTNVHDAISSGHSEMASVMNLLQDSRTQHTLGLSEVEYKQATFRALCCGEVAEWKIPTKSKGE